MFRISDIDLRLIRVFEAVVECGGFSAAQSRLNISTSTISSHIADLEKRFGFRLCDRGRGGFRLTARGRLAYEECKRTLQDIDGFASSIASLRNSLAGRLSLGMVDCLISHEELPLVETLRRLRRKYPGIEIELVVDGRIGLERAVLDGRLHAAFGPFIRDIVGLAFIPLFSERHEIYCGEGHPLFARADTAIGKQELSKHPVVMRTYTLEFDREVFGSVSAAAGASSIEAMTALILTGQYIGFLPRHYAEMWVARGKLRALAGPGLSYDSHHMLIRRASGRRTSLTTAFLAELGGTIGRVIA